MRKSRLKQALLVLTLGATVQTGCTASLSSGSLSANAIQQLPRATIAYEKFTLDNGLTVIVHEDHKAPVVAVNIWYKVGSRDESVGKRGFAHLFEHLMFQGSENYNDDFFRPFEKAGAIEQNGTTNTDRTNYFETVPSSALDVALWMESDRMGHFLGVITQEKLDEQRDVVKNEKRQSENLPYGKVGNRLAEQTFPVGHPYSWPTIGYMGELDAANLDLVKDWFRTYYGPSNAVLVLAGDIDVATAREKVNHYFGDIPAGPPLSRMDSWIARRTEEKRDLMQDRVPQAQILKVWNVAPADSMDSEYLSLVADVLAGGKNSRLYKRLVHDQQLATSVSAFVYARMLAGQFIIVANARDGVDLSRIETVIDEELKQFLKNGPDKKELQRIKFSQAAEFVRGTERVGGLGGKSDILAHGEVYFGDPGHYLTSFDVMQDATPAMLRDAANRWLDSGAYVLNVIPFPDHEHAATGADRSELPPLGSSPRVSLPAIERATLSNGLRVVLAPRHQTPVVSMELLFDGGLSGRLGKPGLPGLTMAMLDEGTASKTSLELAEELEIIGTSLSTGNDFDTSSVYMDCLKVTLDQSLAIMADILTRPAFRETDLERLRGNMLNAVRQEQASPASVASRILPKLLYGPGHAYNTPWSGSGDLDTIASLSRDDLVTYWKTWIRPDNGTLIVTGDTTMEELLPRLERVLSHWQAPATPMPAKSIAGVPGPDKARVYLVDYPGVSQSTIIASQLIMPVNDANALAFSLLNDVIGGQFTSRLNMNLREDKHWAYGARSYVRSTRGQRPYLATAAVQIDKTSEAMMEILREFQGSVGKKPVTDKELDLVRIGRINKLPAAYETNDALLDSISGLVKYNLPDSYLYNYADRVKNTGNDVIRKTARATLRPDRLVWLVVGDLSKIKAGIERLNIGPVIVLNKDGNPVRTGTAGDS